MIDRFRCLRHQLLCLMLNVLIMPCVAQTVAWQLKPLEFESMTRFGYNLFQVVKNGKIGLIQSDGEIVVPIVADKIWGFYEGMALVTENTANNMHRIIGVLTDKGMYTPFKNVYFTLLGQEFFSDGLLSVQDEKGKKGYVDAKGNEVCGFKKNYYRIKPFTEGFASVSEKRSYYYLIDRYGNTVNLKFPSGEAKTLGMVYNVYQGKVLMTDDNQNFHCYKYDLNTGSCEELPMAVKDKLKKKDYLFRPCQVMNIDCTEDVPYYTLPSGTKGMEPYEKNGRYGYDLGSRALLPAQFSLATAFVDDLSIVEVDGKKGLLRYYSDGGVFSVSEKEPLVEFDAGSAASCFFSLEQPNVWLNKKVDVIVKDNTTGTAENVILEGSLYKIDVKPEKSEKKVFDVEVFAEGLHLWTGNMAYYLKKKLVSLVISSMSMDNDITDKDRRVTGSFVLKNPNDEEITTQLSFSFSPLIEEAGGFPRSVKLEPGEQKRIPFYIVTAKRRGKYEHTVSVKSSKGGSATIYAEIETF